MNRNRVRLRRKLRCNRYDHLGRRVQKITPEATHTYFYDRWLLVKEVVERSGDTRRCGVSPRRCGGAGSSSCRDQERRRGSEEVVLENLGVPLQGDRVRNTCPPQTGRRPLPTAPRLLVWLVLLRNPWRINQRGPELSSGQMPQLLEEFWCVWRSHESVLARI